MQGHSPYGHMAVAGPLGILDVEENWRLSGRGGEGRGRRWSADAPTLLTLGVRDDEMTLCIGWAAGVGVKREEKKRKWVEELTVGKVKATGKDVYPRSSLSFSFIPTYAQQYLDTFSIATSVQRLGAHSSDPSA